MPRRLRIEFEGAITGAQAMVVIAVRAANLPGLHRDKPTKNAYEE